MNIFINGKKADITLDTEKTLGDVLQGIDLWISPAGSRIQDIQLDGVLLGDETLSGALLKDIREIKNLEISVSTWRELAAEALDTLQKTCALYMDAQFDDRNQIKSDWEMSAAGRFLASDIRDMYELSSLVLSGEGISASDFSVLIGERQREVSDPKQETDAAENLVKNIAKRMEDLPLDMQTGKDLKAAETVQLFAHTNEKLFRIFFILRSEWLSLDTFMIEDQNARVFIDDFNAALKELSAAYGNRDTVLAGDIAEYELAPRLLKFYTTLKGLTESNCPIIPMH